MRGDLYYVGSLWRPDFVTLLWPSSLGILDSFQFELYEQARIRWLLPVACQLGNYEVNIGQNEEK